MRLSSEWEDGDQVIALSVGLVGLWLSAILRVSSVTRLLDLKKKKKRLLDLAATRPRSKGRVCPIERTSKELLEILWTSNGTGCYILVM